MFSPATVCSVLEHLKMKAGTTKVLGGSRVRKYDFLEGGKKPENFVLEEI